MRWLRLGAKGLRIVAWRARHQGSWVTFNWAWTRLYLWTVGRPVLRYCRVTPQLYVGGQINAKGWRWLTERGLSADVNMPTEMVDMVEASRIYQANVSVVSITKTMVRSTLDLLV